MSERAFQRDAVKYLTYALGPYGAVVGVIPGGDRQATRAPGYVAGEPDVFAIVRGRVHGFELKTPKGRVKAHQKARHAQWVEAGAVIWVSRSLTDLESAVNTIKFGLQPEARG